MMYQLVAVVCSINVWQWFFQFRADGNVRLCSELWIERFSNSVIPYARTFTSVVQHFRDNGTFKPQTHNRGRDMTERILQAEEQILKPVEEEPDISTRQLAAAVGVSQFVVHRTFLVRWKPICSSRSTISTAGFINMWHAIVNVSAWTICFSQQTKRGTVPRVFKQCVRRAVWCGSASRWTSSHVLLAWWCTTTFY